jgi:hypothetical protein
VTAHHADDGPPAPGEGPWDDPAAPVPPPRRRRWLPIVAALLALGALGGGVWLLAGVPGEATPDGPLPLIRADATPYKERPEDPGGLAVPHQDRLVFDRLLPEGMRADLVERLLPPPEEPMERPAPPPLPVFAGPAARADAPAAGGPAADVPAAGAASAGAAPADVPAPAEAPPAAAPAPVPVPVPDAPPPLPLPVQAAEPPAEAPQGRVAALPPPSPIRSESRVQLGSLSSEAGARGEWARLVRRFPDALGDLEPGVVAAQVGGRTVYRLTAGPVDGIRALAICDELRSANAPCIVVRP